MNVGDLIILRVAPLLKGRDAPNESDGAAAVQQQ